MIYLVTKQLQLFDASEYKCISVEESLNIMSSWKIIQCDTETSGRDPHICKLLSVQFGNDAVDTQIVVDTTSVDVLHYKDILEHKLLIFQNGKFDLQFFYNYGIIPRHIYDTMIIEQLLHLGYPSGQVSYSLKSIAYRRLGINIDKTIRGEIIWRGLDTKVILYAAGDVMYLEKILKSQVKDLKKNNLIKAAKI
jgi:ribonuclease D